MHMIRASYGFALGALLVVACAHPATTNDPNGPAPAAASHDRALLVGDELHSSGDQYLYDVVRRLRPDWLRTHGSTSLATGMSGNTDGDPVHVYVGVIRMGGPEILTRLPTNNVDSLKFFSAAQAQARFGPGNVNGVIQVITAVPLPPTF
jgi:hypothetical protein